MVYISPTQGPGEDAKEKALTCLNTQLHLEPDQLRSLSAAIEKEMDKGLKTETSADTNIAMLPSWISRHPTGQEQGEYLGLDLSGKETRCT
jgi:hexokinase